MKKLTLIAFSIFFAVSFIGCRQCSQNNINDPVTHALSTLRVRIVNNDKVGSFRANVNPSVDTPIAVMTLKLLDNKDSQKSKQIRKTCPVANGEASFVFSSLPNCSVIGELELFGAKIGNFTKLRGAEDLKPGENTLLIAGTGSNEDPDLIAGTIEMLLEDEKFSQDLEINITENVKKAVKQTKLSAEPNSSGLLNNIKKVYLAQKSGELPDSISVKLKSHLYQFLTTTTNLSKNSHSNFSGNIKSSLRAGINSWTWSSNYNWWNIYYPGTKTNEGILYTFAFIDSQRNKYRYINSSNNISGFCLGASFSATTVYGFRENIEFYYFTAISSSNYTVTGIYQAKLDQNVFLEIQPSLLEIDLNQPYPVSGSITLEIPNEGKAVIFFDGTCVADIVFTKQSGEAFSTKLFLYKGTVYNYIG